MLRIFLSYLVYTLRPADYILITLRLHCDYILNTCWLCVDHLFMACWLHVDSISITVWFHVEHSLITLWLDGGYTPIKFCLHADCITIAFWLQVDYIFACGLHIHSFGTAFEWHVDYISIMCWLPFSLRVDYSDCMSTKVWLHVGQNWIKLSLHAVCMLIIFWLHSNSMSANFTYRSVACWSHFDGILIA